MTDELQHMVDQHLDDAVEAGAGVSEETHENYEVSVLKNEHSDVDGAREAYEIASNVETGEDNSSLLEKANAAYKAATQFDVFKNEFDIALPDDVDQLKSGGRVVIDSIATLYNETDGKIHDVIFDNAEDYDSPQGRGEEYAKVISGEEGSKGLTSLTGYNSKHLKAVEQLEEISDEAKRQ